jgi:hypothetical protein
VEKHASSPFLLSRKIWIVTKHFYSAKGTRLIRILCIGYFIFLISFIFPSYVSVQLSPQQQVAKPQGIKLFNQHKKAERELRIVAETGGTEAQFYLAEELRQQTITLNSEALQWYEAAATQGDFIR